MKKYIYSFWSPLINFYSAISPITLNENIQIRRLTTFENDEVVSRLSEKWMNIKKTDYLLNITIKKNTPEREPREYFPEARKEIEKAISILRFYSAESIGYNLIVQPYSNEETYAYSAKGILHYVLWDTSDLKDAKRLYKLKEIHEIDELVEFFNE